VRIKSDMSREKDYRREFVRHLREAGVRDEEFIEEFLRGNGEDLESGLRRADIGGSADYEEELRFWVVDKGKKDYETYKPLWQDAVRRSIKPKKERDRRAGRDTADAWERQGALAGYLAEVASADREIRQFRERVMSRRVLSAEAALAFLTSPIAAGHSRPELEMRGIDPLVRASYRYKRGVDDKGPFRRLVLRGRGRTSYAKVRPLWQGTDPVFAGDLVAPKDLAPFRFDGTPLKIGRVVFFPHPCEEGRFVAAKRGSIAANLAELAEDRLKGYPISLGWAMWFILTDEFVPQDAVRISYTKLRRPEFGRTIINLEVEGWLPPEEVLSQYRHAQEEILDKKPRSLKRKTLTMFEFVNRHKGKSWRELYKDWNREYPLWRFEDPRHMNTTYTRTLRVVASPTDLS
jgi:hypothetical protein